MLVRRGFLGVRGIDIDRPDVMASRSAASSLVVQAELNPRICEVYETENLGFES